MQMAIEKPDPPVFSYKFQGIFDTSVFGELAMHTETKMITFTSGPLQGYAFFCKVWIHCLQGETKEARMTDIHQNLGFI